MVKRLYFIIILIENYFIYMANICKNSVSISTHSGDGGEIDRFIDYVSEKFNYDDFMPIDGAVNPDSTQQRWGCVSQAFDVAYDYHDGDPEWKFWTKWSPPYKVYLHLKKEFPDLYIKWRYEEPLSNMYGYLGTDDEYGLLEKAEMKEKILDHLLT